MSDYEIALREGLEAQFGPSWWLEYATPPDLDDLQKATSQAERDEVRARMEARLQIMMHRMLEAGIQARIVRREPQ